VNRTIILVTALIVAAVIGITAYMYLVGTSHTNIEENALALTERCVHLVPVGKSMFMLVKVEECGGCNIVKNSVHISEVMLMLGNKVACYKVVNKSLVSGSVMIFPPCIPKTPGVYKLCVRLSNGVVLCKNNVLIAIMR